MSDHRHIDDKLKEKWEDARFPVGDDMWKRVSASLDQKKRRFFWWTWTSVASVLVMIGGFLIWIYHPSMQEKNEDAERKGLTEQPSSNKAQLKGSDEPDCVEHDILPELENNAISLDTKNNEQVSEVVKVKPKAEPKEGNDLNVAGKRFTPMALPFKSCVKCFEVPYVLFEMPPLAQMDMVVPAVAPSENPTRPDIYLGLHINPAGILNGWAAVQGKNAFINRRFNDVLNQSLAGKYLMNYGLETQVLYNSGWGFELGLDVSKTEETYAYRYEINEFPVVDENKGIVAYLPLAPQDRISVNQQSANHWLMVQLPVTMLYDKKLKNEKFGWTAKLGLSPALLWRTEGYLPDETNLQIRNLTDKVQDGFHLAARFGVSLNYMPAAKWRISTGPILTENLSNMAKTGTALELKPRALGWNLSTSFQLSL